MKTDKASKLVEALLGEEPFTPDQWISKLSAVENLIKNRDLDAAVASLRKISDGLAAAAKESRADKPLAKLIQATAVVLDEMDYEVSWRPPSHATSVRDLKSRLLDVSIDIGDGKNWGNAENTAHHQKLCARVAEVAGLPASIWAVDEVNHPKTASLAIDR